MDQMCQIGRTDGRIKEEVTYRGGPHLTTNISKLSPPTPHHGSHYVDIKVGMFDYKCIKILAWLIGPHLIQTRIELSIVTLPTHLTYLFIFLFIQLSIHLEINQSVFLLSIKIW